MRPAGHPFSRWARLGQALALLALVFATTAQVGSCSPGRSRPTGSTSDLPMSPEMKRRLEQSRNDNWHPPEKLGMRASVTPSPARLGQALRYRAVVLADRERKVRFEPPRSGGAFTWSAVRAGREHSGRIFSGGGWVRGGAYEPDSVWLEARLQVFETGPVSIPGPVVQLDPAPNSRRAGATRLPTVHLVVMPTVTAADTGQSLRGLHGPLGAPWWERLPLTAIVAGGLLMVAAVLIARQLRKRKPKPLPRVAPAMAPLRPRLDPAAEAIRALAALRAKAMPANGRFGEHALELTAILRRFLEATVTTPRPGDTSGELLERLRASRLAADDLERLEGLLGLWDRVKFARAPLTEAEATRCEDAVEAYVRRVAQARLEAEAAAARAAAARAAAQQRHGQSRPAGPPPPARPPGQRPPPAPEAA